MSLLTPERRKHSFLVSAKSREQLIQETSLLPSNRQRRTKIMATVGDKTLNYENIKQIVQAGASGFNMNTSYTKSKNAIKDMAKIRDQLEKDLDCFIPLNLQLRGRQVRIGDFKGRDIFIKAGQVLRLTSEIKLLGDSNIISVDDEQFFDQVRVGEKIVIDYGQVVLKVSAKEDSDTAYKQLMEQYPVLYPTLAALKRQNVDDEGSDDISECDTFSRATSRKNSITSANKQLNTGEDTPIEETTPQTERQKRKNKYAEALVQQKEQKKKKKHKILVCIVQVDSTMKPFRPIFILNEANWIETDTRMVKVKRSFQNLQGQFGQGRIIEQDEEEHDDSDEGEESQITAKDIVFIKTAKRFGYDSVTISNVHKACEVRELRNLMGEDCNMKILVKITTKEAVDNFKEIVQESDGIIIARAYILVQSAIETVVQQELDMIRKTHKCLKPVLISSQVLESMITSLFPNFSEMGDIANLVNEDIDSIVLTGETAYGAYPIQAIATLDRVCKFVEANQIQKRIERFAERAASSLIASKKHVVANAIASATVDAAYRISAKLIIVFTSTGSTALKISKLKPPCQIISVTSNQKVARQLSLIGGIMSLCFGTLSGTEILQQRVIQLALDKKVIKKSEYVIMLSGSIENLSGQINALKIMQIS